MLIIAGCDQSISNQNANLPDGAYLSDELVTYTEVREPCEDRNAFRNAYFGDLHVHTAYSYDARPAGVRTTPEDAYNFAKGQPIPVPPYGADGRVLTTQQLSRPLDFAAVTDHSEFFGELQLCDDPDSSVYDSKACQSLRGGGPSVVLTFARIINKTNPKRLPDICGEDGTLCVEESVTLWQRTQEMAEAAYDRSTKCAFSSFVAYEYTGTPDNNNYHRNVIFRNSKVPERAISYIEAPTDRDLWAQLNKECLEGVEGCDVIAIPHNSNISSGSMFPSYMAGFETTAAARDMAEIRNVMEPVLEIFQHKGNSECFNGFPDILGEPDELCDVEQILELGAEPSADTQKNGERFCEDGEIGSDGFLRSGCISKNDFYRSILLTGLQDEAAIGVNSYKFGAIGSTDAHMSLAGSTDEASWHGHIVPEADLSRRLSKQPMFPNFLDANPGGLAGIWAVENSRDALFEALSRREVFGTTGTRIKPRLFGGWDFPEGACEFESFEDYGYNKGVPMGSNLRERPKDANPTFFATALQDSENAPLQRLQIIKGWVDEDGKSNYKVFDVAGEAMPDDEIDLDTGFWSGNGYSSLCSVFEDTEFNPRAPSYYYLRAVEVPSLRWSWAQCVALPAQERPATCENDAPKIIQELAWTSPIWYVPVKQAPEK